MPGALFAAATSTPATLIASYALRYACEYCRTALQCQLLLGATPRETREAILAGNPSLLGLEGHGAPGALALQDKRVFLSAEDHRSLSLLGDRVVLALSCYTARLLGRLAIDYGAKAYIGWSEEFLFASETIGDPFTDKYAWMFFKPVAEALVMLCAGKPAETAAEHIRLSYSQYAEQVLRSPEPSAQLVAAMLYHDAETLRLLGDPNATCCPPRRIEITTPPRRGLAPLLLLGALILLAYMR